MLAFKWIQAPFGRLKLVGAEEGLAAVLWDHDKPRRVPLGPVTEDRRHPVLMEAERQLAEYFAGRRMVFDLPLAASGTPFQLQVWQALLRIPYGETRTYGAIAREIGHPAAARAVGAANGRNPLSIIAPCHRVIGASGALTGFAGGLAVKRYLLDLERDDLFAANASSRDETASSSDAASLKPRHFPVSPDPL
jgi:methylated-DNA-[protein]-cysteine S-methyltransferase